jgi:hypothetical protein
LERDDLINEITKNPAYLDTCKKLDAGYSDDIFQEVIIEILTIPAERLPTLNYLQFWYYCVAKNIISRNGKLGKLFSKEIPMDEFIESESERIIDDSDLDFKKIENFMLGCSEFENRIVLLYAEHKSMRKISKITGISYSALRSVKEKIKKFANENPCNNSELS